MVTQKVRRERRIAFEEPLPEKKERNASLENQSWYVQTKEEFCAQIQAGLDDYEAGRFRPAEDVFRDLERKYGS